MSSIRRASAGVLALLCVSWPARAQTAAREQTSFRQLRVVPRWGATPPPPAWDPRSILPYLDWGAGIGAAGGFAWGVATEHRRTRKLDIAGDVVLGFTAGIVGGGLAYVIHLARRI